MVPNLLALNETPAPRFPSADFSYVYIVNTNSMRLPVGS
jgi:hypothetical protein